MARELLEKSDTSVRTAGASNNNLIIVKRSWLFSASLAITFFGLGGLLAYFVGMVVAPLALRMF